MAKYADPNLIYSKIAPLAIGQNTFSVGIDGPDCSGKTTLAQNLAKIAQFDFEHIEIVHLDQTFSSKSVSSRKNPNPVAEMLLEFFSYEIPLTRSNTFRAFKKR